MSISRWQLALKSSRKPTACAVNVYAYLNRGLPQIIRMPRISKDGFPQLLGVSIAAMSSGN